MPYRSVFRPGLFAERTIIVTGGGSGIGRCTAHELSALGARLVLIGRKPEKLEKVAAEIAEDGGRAACYPCDIREEAQVQPTVQRLLDEQGPVHALVNNAGGQFPAPLADISQKGWETVVRTNLTGGFLMSRELYAHCFKEHGGAIVNIIADMWHSMPGMGHSGAARAGMLNLTQTAAVEWAPAGVRVNAVAPGWIASSGADTYSGEFRKGWKLMHRHVPLQRLGTEAEVSAAIVFLLSPAAAFITGSVLRVDGGVPNMVANVPAPEHDRSAPFEGFHRATRPRVLDEDA